MKEKVSSRREERIRITRGKIDLASIKPPGIEMKVNKTWIHLRHGKSEAKIRRYVDAAQFARILGLIRSDGSKTENRLRFSNKEIELHQVFVDIMRKLGITNFKAQCYYNPARHGYKKLREAIRQYMKKTGITDVNVYYHECAYNPMLHTDVNNIAIKHFILYAEWQIRWLAAKHKLPNEVTIKYIRGIIEGDGNLEIKIKNNKCEGMHLRISESNEVAAMHVAEIIRRITNIRLTPCKSGDIAASIDLADLLLLWKMDLIPDKYMKKVRERLVIAMKNKDFIWVLMNLWRKFKDKEFTSTEAAELLEKQKHHMLETLKLLEQKEFISSRKVKLAVIRPGTPVRRLFKINKNTKELLRALSSLFSFLEKKIFLEN